MSKTSKISKIFDIKVAKSKGVDSYAEGEVPFVTSATINNGVVAYVSPTDDDRLFEGPCMVISGLGYATVQLGTFLPKGNGGDSLTVLSPKKAITVETLLGYAAAFNSLHGWRFSFGRKCSKTRIEGLELPSPPPPLKSAVTTARSSLEEIMKTLGVIMTEKIEPLKPAKSEDEA